MKLRTLALLVALSLGANPARAQALQSTNITFQGLIQQSGTPLTGLPNLEFRLVDSLGTQVGPTLTRPNWPVSAGQLIVDLDFGAVFNGQRRFLSIAINGTTLTPSVPLASTPYALAAQTTLGNSVNGTSIVDGTVGPSDINTATVQLRVQGSCTAGNALRVINQDGTVACEPVSGGGGSGDITAVITPVGSGLAGGTLAGDATLSIPPSGITATMIGADQVGSSEVADGSLSTLDIDPSMQRRVSASCAAGNAIRQIDATGNVTCEPLPAGGTGDITGVNTIAGSGLTGGAATGEANLAIAGNGVSSVMIADGAISAADLGTDSVGSDEIQDSSIRGSHLLDSSVQGIDIANGTITGADVNSSSVQVRVAGICAEGSSIRQINADGTAICQTSASGTGDITAVNAGSGLAGGASTGDATLSIAPNGISFAMIGAGQVSSSTVADGSLTGTDISDSSLSGSDVTDSSLTGADILNGSLSGSEIMDNSLAAADILNGSLTGLEITDGTIAAADVDSSQVQRRVGSGCLAGSSIRTINADGTVACEDDTTGTFSGWGLSGNAGTTASSNYIGTSDGASMRIQADGGLGVNVSAPLAPLHVRLGAPPLLPRPPDPGTVINAERVGGNAFISIMGGVGQQRGLIFGEASNPADAGVFYDNGGNGLLDLRTGGNVSRMLLGVSDYDGSSQPGGLETTLRLLGTDSTGYIAVRGTSLIFGTEGRVPRMSVQTGQTYFDGLVYVQGRLEVAGPDFFLYDGNAFKPGGGPFATFSDERLKQNIAPLGGALDRLLDLRGVTFEFRPDDSELTPAGTQIGFIAQEVREVFPDWIDEGKDGYLSVASSGFEALTVEALRDLKAEKDVEIEVLREENSTLRAELASIRDQIARLAALQASAR